MDMYYRESNDAMLAALGAADWEAADLATDWILDSFGERLYVTAIDHEMATEPSFNEWLNSMEYKLVHAEMKLL